MLLSLLMKSYQIQLENLVKGTKEWENALIEANNTVSELIKKYPQIAKWVDRGQDGQLIIREEGLEELRASKEKGVRRTTTAHMVSLLQESLHERETTGSSIKDYVTNQGLAVNYENLPALQKAYKTHGASFFTKDENGNYSDELLSIAGSWAAVDDLERLGQAFIEYDNFIMQSNSEIEKLGKNVAELSASQKVLDYEFGDQITTAIGKVLGTENYNDRLERKKTEVKAEKLQIDELKELYSSLSGIDISEIPENIQKDANTLQEAIAELQLSDEIAEQTDLLQDKLEKLARTAGRETQELFASLISGSISGLDFGQINDIVELEGSEGVKIFLDEQAKAMGYSDDGKYTALTDLADSMGYGDATLSDFSEAQEIYLFEAVKLLVDDASDWTDIEDFYDAYEGSDRFLTSDIQLLASVLENQAKIEAQRNDAVQNL